MNSSANNVILFTFCFQNEDGEQQNVLIPAITYEEAVLKANKVAEVKSKHAQSPYSFHLVA